MNLQELLEQIPYLRTRGDVTMDITGVSYDSREVKPGDLFVAMTGFATDGHKYIPQALAQGAVAVVCERWDEDATYPCVEVVNGRKTLALLGANFYGHPAKAMTMIGLTGTNGKTSSTYLLKEILERCTNAKVGLIGTNQNMIGSEIIPTERTTPESFALQGLFAQMRDAGCSHVVMEVSSHALSLSRVYGVEFAVGVFTNLTQDHLDFHKDMEDYCDAKGMLFSRCATGVYNCDDPWSQRLMKNATCKQVSYGLGENAQLRGMNLDLHANAIDFDVMQQGETTHMSVDIPGKFMVYNTLGVLGAAQALGVPLSQSAQVLATVTPIKGRVEVVPTPNEDYTMLIDYAHSPDGLENVLTAVKGFAKGRTIAVFGCGGDRDRTKRPKMGAIAGRLSDVAVVTSDNPRTEVPGDIIAEILTGMNESTAQIQMVENRVEAVHWAMDFAQAGDVIVLCGKGHETYQEIHHVKHHLDEREVVAEYAKEREQR